MSANPITSHLNAGVVLPATIYATYSTTAFALPENQGAYSLDNPNIQAKEEVEHETKAKEYKRVMGVVEELKAITQQKVETVWLDEVEDKIMGYLDMSV